MVQEKLNTQVTHLESLQVQLEQEQLDVDKLARLSLASLFYTLLGGREEQLEQAMAALRSLKADNLDQIKRLQAEKLSLIENA